jgi:gliding motility-associated-like protein
MRLRSNKISQVVKTKNSSLIMRALLLCVALLVFIAEGIEAQVINNTGSAISVAGAVVNTKDLENNAGTLGNNGTIYMNGYLLNSGSINGNGLYNLKGNWTNFGSFNAGTSTVTLYGTTNQTITTNSLGESFWNLTIDNTGSVITQISLPGGTLGVQKDLTLTAGTLTLDPTTSFLNIGGKATVDGLINYNGSTTQTTTIVDDFTGSGTFNMGTNNLPHNLNLAGSLNSIGTFIPGSGSSTVNYNGTVPTQTVFAHPGYRNLIISNSGSKILQGSSVVGINLTITGGTFDLGTTTSTLSVAGNTAITGAMSFNTGTPKTVTLTGNLSGGGAIDMNGNSHAHQMNLYGFSNSIGSYTSAGSESTVNYFRPGDQSVFTSENYRNLSITGSGVKTLSADIAASGILTMSSGDINSNGNTLKLTNPAVAAINRTAGKVIGKLQRAVAVTGSEYLYPLGSTTNYNPMKIAFQSLVAGALTAQFQTGYIGNAGLPLYDDGVEGNEIYDTYATGYWTLSAVGSMTTGSYSVNLNHAGFTPVDQSASIIKRTDGGNLEIDGIHAGISATEIARTTLVNGISTTTTDLAIGRGRPRITNQPDNIDICELSNAFFEVTARGRGTLTYQWQVNQGSGWNNVTNTGVYSGATTNYLTLTTAPYSMNGYLYRTIITDAQGNSNITNTVLLTVNLIPTAVPTPSSQNECPGVAFTTIVLTSYSPTTGGTVPGTTFTWTRNSPAGIVTTLPLSGFATGDMIPGTFTNTLDAPVTVTFTITPKGPGTTFCVGPVSYAYVTVNPTPRVFGTPQNSTQCDSITTSINLSSPSTFTSGLVTFRYTVTTTGSVSGYVTPTTGMPNGHTIADKLVNLTDVYQIVTYRVIPVSPVGCAEGPSQEIKVTVNPTPRVIPVNIKPDICPAGASPTNTQIVLTSPTVMTSGAMRFDYTITKTDGFVIGNTAPGINKIPGDILSFGYQNNSDTIKSVYYHITPKVDNAICVPGPKVVSEVKVHARPLQSIVITKPLTCSGGSGLAGLAAIRSKGADPYQVVWNGPVGYYMTDSLVIANLSSGKYIVKITDNLGCNRKDSISIVPVTAKASIQASIIATVPPTNYNITCIGSNDGTILVSVTGGITPPYTYSVYKNDVNLLFTGVFTNNFNFSDPSTFKTYTGLGAGSYTLTIRDINGCENTSRITFRVPPPIVVGFKKSEYPGGFNVSCKGYNDGSAEVLTITGGRGGYTYRWYTVNGLIPGPVNTNRIDNLIAGKYYLETKDFTGCAKIDSVTITEPEGMQLVSSVLSHSADGNFNISCDGGNDGNIAMTITGGSGSYIYSWTSPNGFSASIRNISGLKAGVYTCVVRDVNGCILTPSPQFTLTDPDPLDINLTPSTSADGSYNINCNGGTGSVTTTVTGGSTGNYTYTWSTANGSGIVPGQKDQPALTAGKYYLDVKDLNNCILRDSITLTQPPVFVIQLNATNITCAAPGFNNGSINLTVAGGAGAYSYSWSNGATTEDIAGLTQGNYQVTVTYNNTCSKTDAVQINLPPPLTYTIELSDYNGYSISCFGLADGAINITPTTGLAPFTYSWTGPDGFTASSNQITSLKAGVYTLTITDSNYCTATEAITLTQPGKLGMTINLSESIAGGFNINCAGNSNGTIGIEPLNQVKYVQYIWSDGVIGKSRTGLPAGVYTVIITDENNCHATSAITLTQPDTIKLNYTVKQPFCPDKPDGEISLNVTGGVKGADYIYKWSDNSTGRSVSNILRGFYKMTVTDMNGCQVKDSVIVEPLNETCLIIPNAISPNDDLINDEWNIGMIELYPQMEIRVFNRWGETVWRSEKGYPKPWDGKSNGADLPVDSYHYIINLHNGSKPIVGGITIVR